VYFVIGHSRNISNTSKAYTHFLWWAVFEKPVSSLRSSCNSDLIRLAKTKINLTEMLVPTYNTKCSRQLPELLPLLINKYCFNRTRGFNTQASRPWGGSKHFSIPTSYFLRPIWMLSSRLLVDLPSFHFKLFPYQHLYTEFCKSFRGLKFWMDGSTFRGEISLIRQLASSWCLEK
jgi:hypothetical protein